MDQSSLHQAVETGDLTDLAADFSWRCGSDLRLDRLEILNPARGDGLVRALRGMRLDRIAEKLPYKAQREALIGQLAAQAPLENAWLSVFPDGARPIHVMLRARPVRDRHGRFAGYQGVGQVHDEKPYDEQQRGELGGLLERAEAARDRETVLRRETEVLLKGLQILVRPEPLAEKCEELFATFADLLGFEAALVIRRGLRNRMTVVVATDPEAANEIWPETEDLAAVLRGEAVSLDDLADRVAPDELPQAIRPVARAALLAPLRLGREGAVLIALHGTPGFFKRRHLNLLQRLSLIATQAFQDEDRKASLANASKLASLGEMLSTIAHELGQPLSVISMSAQNGTLMLEEDEPKEDVIAKFDRIHEQTTRAGEIIAAIRHLAHPMRPMAELGPIELADVFNGLRVMTEATLKRSSIVQRFEKPETCRPVRAHMGSLQQVLINLTVNARDAINDRRAEGRLDGDGEIVVRVIDDRSAPTVCILVEDNGGGVPEDIAEAIFDSFYTLKEAGKGTGLGLAICRSLLSDMGGTIELRNSERGAVFDVGLPAA